MVLQGFVELVVHGFSKGGSQGTVAVASGFHFALSLSLSVPVSPLLQIVSAGVLPVRFNPVMSGNSSCTPSLSSPCLAVGLSPSLCLHPTMRQGLFGTLSCSMQTNDLDETLSDAPSDLLVWQILGWAVQPPLFARSMTANQQANDLDTTSPGCSRQSCVPSYVCHILIHDSLQQQAYQ